MTFAERFSTNLAGFSWQIAPDAVPEATSVHSALDELHTWWWSLDERTQGVLDNVDLAPGLRAAGFASAWPGLLDLLQGLPMGRFRDTINDIVSCYWNAQEAADADTPT